MDFGLGACIQANQLERKLYYTSPGYHEKECIYVFGLALMKQGEIKKHFNLLNSNGFSNDIVLYSRRCSYDKQSADVYAIKGGYFSLEMKKKVDF